jgi:hypothetical protein
VATGKPARLNRAWWFSHEGFETSTVESGLLSFRRPAPRRSPPVPPRAWTVTTRPSATTADSEPKMSSFNADTYVGIPSIGR